jgi:NAD(P)H-dependent FMN reductase
VKSERIKKVTAFIGSPHQGATYRAVQEFEANLKSYADIDFECVWLRDCHLEYCRGCRLCFDKGEEYCPARDDRDLLLEKLQNSDGVIFATPSYAFQVTAPMKTLLDRTAFIFHRPRFFGKTFTAIVPYAVPLGGASVVKYLHRMGELFGFHVARGCCVNTLLPITEFRQKRNSQEIKKASARFYAELMRQTPPTPSFFWLMGFRVARTSMKLMLDERALDYRHYREKGWFESEYFYDVPLGPVKRLAGRLFDFLGVLIVKQSG